MSAIFFPIFMSGKKDSNWYLKIPPSGKSSWKPLNISYNSLSSYLENTKFPSLCLTRHFTPCGSPSTANHPGSARTFPAAPAWCWEPRPLSWILWRCKDRKRSPERVSTTIELPTRSPWWQSLPSQVIVLDQDIQERYEHSTTCHHRYCFFWYWHWVNKSVLLHNSQFISDWPGSINWYVGTVLMFVVIFG